MARPKEFDQQKALWKAVRLFSQQGFAATSTDELMRVMDVGRRAANAALRERVHDL
jgi:TetR/AcrR family transcriptional regulator, transcriptional repressor for nem operon